MKQTPITWEHDDLLSRPDLRRVAELIEPESSVLDLGCGDGSFLRYLVNTKSVKPLGIEIDVDELSKCVAQGIPVVQGDLNQPLSMLGDQSFDCVLLMRTLQQIQHPERLLTEVVRIGRRGLVGFINFGYLGNRFQLFCSGRMPRNPRLPYAWYNTPNIHFGTIHDFRELCRELGIEIVRAFPLGVKQSWAARSFPNLFAHGCIFEIRRSENSNAINQ